MAGLYLHIPFCRQACYYCNFHFSTSAKDFKPMVEAMVREIELRKDYLQGKSLGSVYLGGGTPSLLTQPLLEQLFNSIHKHFIVLPDAEVTLEANPDDLDAASIIMLRKTPVNRLSIGIQSFFEEDLQAMNRAHNAAQAAACVQQVLDAGFSNISADLIYGIPGLTDEKWQHNIDTAVGYGINHLSCYALTVEPRTALDTMIRQKKALPVSEEQGARQFEVLVATLEQYGFEQYEISNFARNGKYAIHNTSYWKGEPYLGIGPSAHSFNKTSRSWNVANNNAYIKALAGGQSFFETEELTTENRFNEMVMTGLRTMWGCNMNQITEEFGETALEQLRLRMRRKENAGLIESDETHFRLTRKGRLLADGIAADLFV